MAHQQNVNDQELCNTLNCEFYKGIHLMRLFQSEIRQSSYVEDLMSYRVLSYRKKTA